MEHEDEEHFLLTYSTLLFATICGVGNAGSRLPEQIAVRGADDQRCERKGLQKINGGIIKQL